MLDNNLILTKSPIDYNFTVGIIFKEHNKYKYFKPLFKTHGMAIMRSKKKIFFINGESLKKYSYNHLLAVQAHEIAHYILKHKEVKDKQSEKEADIAAIIILQKKEYNIAAKILKKRCNSLYGKNLFLPRNKEILLNKYI